jgi:type VII secretion integral membrane protein EccD
LAAVASPIGLGLARLTIASSGRRIDLALPEQVPLAELVPTLLHHLGESLHDGPDGDATGWNVRRSDGSALAYDRSLAAQQVRDGEVLHLVPRDKDWPEPEYDDLVLAIADGGRQLGAPWRGSLTRTASLLGAAGAMVTGVVVLLFSGPSWRAGALCALVAAGIAVLAGAVLSRAAADSGAGGIVAAAGVPYAFVGGLLLLAEDAPLSELGPAQLLVGSTLTLMVSVVGFLAVADRLWLFVAGVVLAVHGVLGALLAFTSIDGSGAAAMVICVALLLLPMAAVLSVRMAGMPLPDLPQTAQELMADRPLPPRDQVTAAVIRADEIFAGLLLGAALTTVAAEAMLIRAGTAAQVLAGIVAVLLVVRSRTLVRPKHRAPLLVCGGIGAIAIATALVLGQPVDIRPYLVCAGMLPVALAVAAGGVRYARRRPTPQVGRLVDLLEFLLTVAVVPLAFVVLGLFAYVRGIGG